jgi:hypothetical protein
MLRSCSLSSISLGFFGLLLVGGVAACSDNDRRGGDKPAAVAPAVSGSLRLALSARGESGALYRLRDTFFQVRNDDFSFFQNFSTEDNPTASTLEASLPIGNFFVDAFGSFSLEKVDEAGETTRVQATLVSPSTQAFSISNNQETQVSYRFETNGEIVNFGAGQLVITLDVTERAGEARRSVIETSQEALSGFGLRDMFDAALRNAGSSSDGTEDVYHALIDSYNEAPGRIASGRHCDDELSGRQPSLNGFPLSCPRLEGEQFDNLDSWFPIAFVNRLDLAPSDGANCGQQRIIFANNSFIGAGRMFIIAEAQIPNPAPECGVSACRPIADFWESLSVLPEAQERGQRLRDAFLVTGTGPIGPFMNADHLGPDGGQIRTNNFNDFTWTLREFQLDEAPSRLPIQTSVAEAPNGDLWNDTSALPQAAVCRQSILDALPHLLSNNLAVLAFPVNDVCEDAESPNDGFRQDYASHLSFGTGEFASEIDAQLAGTGLSAFDVANRARFAGSCMGCHIEAGGSSLGGGLSAPFQNDFVQVSEQQTEPCTGGGTCFGISEALRSVFLPHRINVQRNFLASEAICGGGGGSVDGGVALPTEPSFQGDAGAPLARPARAPVRTLGGQPVVDNAH